MKNGKHQYQRLVFGLVTLMLLALTGCSMPGTTQKDTLQSADSGNILMTSTVGNYEDIELPSEMKYNPKNSMSIKTNSFRGGIIHYTGRVEMHSLKEFIIVSMKKHKWKWQVKYPVRM